MKRMYRVAWIAGTVTEFADYPKRCQARRHEAALRALRGMRAGGEIVYPVWVEPTLSAQMAENGAQTGLGATQGAEWATG